MNWRSKQGYSLAEILIVMGLLSLILGAVALLTRDLFRSRRLLSRQTLRGTAIQLAMQSVRADIESAVVLLAPAGGASATLELTQVEGSVSRYPATLFPPGVGNFNPLPARALKTVLYEVTGSELIREVTWNNGNTTRSLILEEVDGFSVTPTSFDNLSYQLRVSGSPSALTGEAFCPCLP